MSPPESENLDLRQLSTRQQFARLKQTKQWALWVHRIYIAGYPIIIISLVSILAWLYLHDPNFYSYGRPQQFYLGVLVLPLLYFITYRLLLWGFLRFIYGAPRKYLWVRVLLVLAAIAVIVASVLGAIPLLLVLIFGNF